MKRRNERDVVRRGIDSFVSAFARASDAVACALGLAAGPRSTGPYTRDDVNALLQRLDLPDTRPTRDLPDTRPHAA